MSNSLVPLISLVIISFGIALTFNFGKPKTQSIGWTITTIGMFLSCIHCFATNSISLAILNLVVGIFDASLAITRYNEYKYSHLNTREKFLNEILNKKKNI